LEHDNWVICSPHLRTAEEIRGPVRKGGGGISSVPLLLYITVLLYYVIIVNEPIFVLFIHCRSLINIICAPVYYRYAANYYYEHVRYIVCFNLMSGICDCLVTVILKRVENIRNVVFNMKSCMYGVRFLWWHVESAVSRRGWGQVYPGTVRCKYERVAYTGSVTCEGGRDGTARVVLVGWAGVVPGGNRLVCCCRRCSEDLGRELHKFTYIQRAGKCWNRIGTSTIVFLILFYDG